MNREQFIKDLESKYDNWEVFVNASEITFINNTWSSETELSLNQIFSFMDDCKVITFHKVLIKTNATYFREINTTVSVVVKHNLEFED
jgi:hypothetical protein